MTLKRLLSRPMAMFCLACVLAGCQTSQTPKTKPPTTSGIAQSTRNNCYSLLYQLLDEQKDVSMLRFIKREHIDVKNLIKRIAAASKADAQRLEDMAKNDPTISLNNTLLPAGETATRDAIASTKEKALLSLKGDEFELTLLLTQTEALNYAWHLAKVASENESDPARARTLSDIGRDMESLYNEVFLMLLAKIK